MYGSLIFNVLYEKQFGAIDNFDAINIDFVDWNEYRRLLCVDDGWRWKHIPYHIASVKISISRYTRSSDQKKQRKKRYTRIHDFEKWYRYDTLATLGDLVNNEIYSFADVYLWLLS